MVSMYGDWETKVRYVPLMALVAQIPGLKSLFPPNVEYLDMTTMIFADQSDSTIAMLVELVTHGQIMATEFRSYQLMELLESVGVDVFNQIDIQELEKDFEEKNVELIDKENVKV